MRYLIGRIAFLLGAALIVLLTVLVVWPDFESQVVSTLLPADDDIPTMSCPYLMGRDEVAEISADFTNSSSSPMRLRVDGDISAGSLTITRQDNRIVEVPAGQTETLIWEVTADDAVYDRMVVGRFFSYRNNVLPQGATNCGIMVVNVPFLSGQQLFWMILLSGLAMTGIGIWLLLTPWPIPFHKRRTVIRYMAFGATLLAPLYLGLTGQAVMAMLVAVIPALLLLSLLENSLSGQSQQDSIL